MVSYLIEIKEVIISYNSSAPQASDPIAISQRQILSNFQAMNSVWSVNHTSLTGNDEVMGMHNVLTLQSVSAPTTGAAQVGLYNALVAGIPAMFFAPNNAQTPIQLTYPSVGASSHPNFRYYSFVAGPFVVYGGYVPNPTNGQVITLLPTTTLIYAGVNELGNSNPNIGKFSCATNLTGSSFTINYNTAFSVTGSVYFVAIGKP